MRTMFLMLGLFGFSLLVCASPPQTGKSDQKTPTLKLDGEWTTVYVEIDGKKVDTKDFSNVTIKKNVVACRHGGKEQMFQLEFGPHHMIRCTQQGAVNAITEPTEQRIAHTHHGVYVASQDYLCLSLNKGIDMRLGKSASADRWEGHGPSGADMVIVLRRSGPTGVASR